MNSPVGVMRSDHGRLRVWVVITVTGRSRIRTDGRELPLLFPLPKTNVKYRGFGEKARPTRLPPAPPRQLDKCAAAARLASTGGEESWRDVRLRRDFNHRFSPGVTPAPHGATEARRRGAGCGGGSQATPLRGRALAFSQRSADTREEDGVAPCGAQHPRRH